MTIHFLCGHCQTATKAEDRLAGRTLKCFTCGGLFQVPPAPAAPPPPIQPVAAFAPEMPAPEATFEPVAAFAPEMPASEAPFELDDESHLFGGEVEAPVAAVLPETPAEVVDGDDIDIAALLEEEPAAQEYPATVESEFMPVPGASPFDDMEAAVLESEPAVLDQFDDLEVAALEPEPAMVDQFGDMEAAVLEPEPEEVAELEFAPDDFVEEPDPKPREGA